MKESEDAFFLAQIDKAPDEGAKAIQAYEAGSRHIEVLKAYVRESYKRGALESLLEHEGALSKASAFKRLYGNIKSNAQLLRHGFEMPRPEHCETLGTVDKHRVLYLLHNSLPVDSGGYATRTHGLLKAIAENGYRISGVTRHGYPHDRGPKYADVQFPAVDLVNGIGYFRNNGTDQVLGSVPIIKYLQKNLHTHLSLIRKEKPVILHGASNYINGVGATFLAKKFGIKSVYEVRGLWEITRASREPGYTVSDAYRQYARMEAECCNNADHVLAITGALKDILVDRGVPAEKITIVPNGVDSDLFVPLTRNEILLEQCGFAKTDVIVGYLGSVVDYEGIDDLVRAFGVLRDRGVNQAKLLIVGDGAVLDDVKRLTEQLGLNDRVVFTGRVPHSQIPDYYSIVDVAPFPRKPLPVTEAVSPLKPFEALAMGKCIISSNVKALDEIIVEGETGLKFQKGVPEDLARVLETVVLNRGLRLELGERGREWVTTHRDWRAIGKIVADVYKSLIE